MSNDTQQVALVGDVHVSRRVEFALRVTVVGTLTGIVGGLGTYMYGNADITPFPDLQWLGLVAVVLAGLYTQWLTRDLRESFGAAGVAFLFGGAVCLAAWIYPVYALGYTGVAAELAGAPRVRDAVADIITVYLMLFAGSYLAALTVSGFLE